MSKSLEYLKETVSGLLKSTDTDCIVFVDHESDLDELGRYISALANQAVLYSKPYAYALWGINPKSREVIGTEFSPDTTDFVIYLSTNTNFSLDVVDYGGKRIVVLEVRCAIETTIQYKGDEYILYNQHPDKLSNFQDEEKQIWRRLDKYLDCNKLFDLLNIPYPQSTMGVINTLRELRFVKEQNTGKYTITNLGALLLARRLSVFGSVQYKAVRVLKYDGTDITQGAKEQVGGKGYLVGFEGLIDYIVKLLPVHEVIDGAIRKQVPDFPILSVRELVANALIHQDFTVQGCPIISIFPNRIEITNPGTPLVKLERFIDTPPCSRNEALASAMRRAGICEERGSGYDKVVSYVEQYNLPAPKVTVYDNQTKVELSSKKSFESLTKEERVLACYNHTCLNYVRRQITNNNSLRLRFQLSEDERYKISRVFSDASKYVVPKEGTGAKNREYLPFWAE